jgi:phospholipid:diacylglycerol acyltransferase
MCRTTSRRTNNLPKDLNPTGASYLPTRRDPITSRVGIVLSIIAVAFCCDVLVGKPVLQQIPNDVQLLNEIFGLSTNFTSNYENTLRLINETFPAVLQEPERARPGKVLASQGARAKYPVVLIPGFLTSGLDLWAGEECAEKHERQKVWGSLSVFLQTFATDMKCYVKHLALDPFTGGDPENIKIRASAGFDGTNYFFNVIWVWDKLMANLVDVGYDSTNMMMMAYDWRASFNVLEERDGYFSELKMNIELLKKKTGEPVVITGHSMGAQVVLYFLKWVTVDEADGGGGGGSDWVEKNIKDFINISGPLLGVPKSATALLSGEFQDFASLPAVRKLMMEKWLQRKTRYETWNTWGSLFEMLPKGGDLIWETDYEPVRSPDNESIKPNIGTETETETDVCIDSATDSANESSQKPERSTFLTFSEDAWEDVHEFRSSPPRGWTVDETLAYIKKKGAGHGDRLYGPNNIASWSDPLKTPLPDAPSMKVYCFYGFGIPTERFYSLRKTIAGDPGYESYDDGEDPGTKTLPIIIDTSVHDPDENIIFGSRSVDGDISVPLMSLGYVCADPWRTSKTLNPSGIEIITRELKHKEGPKPRGPYSSEHVDILGNLDFTTDMLKIVTDFSEPLEDRFLSDIQSLSQKITANLVKNNVTI